MNISKDKIYFQIKNRYPYLNDSDIFNLQKKVLNKLNERTNNFNDNLNLSENLISNLRLKKS